MKIKKLGALLVSAALCAGMAAPAFAFEGEAAPVEQPVLPEVVEEDVVTVTDETSGALTPEGNLTLVDDYHTDYSDGSGQQFITLVSKSGATFYLVIDRNAKGQQTVHFMNLVDEADLLALMEEDSGGQTMQTFEEVLTHFHSFLESATYLDVVPCRWGYVRLFNEGDPINFNAILCHTPQELYTALANDLETEIQVSLGID